MSVKLTEAQLVMMNAAAQRKDRCLSVPATIKGAALSKVGVKLAKLGLAREIEANDAVIAHQIRSGDIPVMQVAPQAVNQDDSRPAPLSDVVDRGRGTGLVREARGARCAERNDLMPRVSVALHQ